MLHPVLHDHGRALHIHRYRYAGLQRDREARSFSLREKKGKGKMTAAAAAAAGGWGERGGNKQTRNKQNCPFISRGKIYPPMKPRSRGFNVAAFVRGATGRSPERRRRRRERGGGEEGERRQKRGHPASRERACGAIVTARALSSRPLETFPVVRGPFVNPAPPPPAAAASSHLAAPPAPVLERRFAE